MASSLRRSGRVRIPPSDADLGAGVAAGSSSNASDDADGRPKRKRLSSSSTGSPETAMAPHGASGADNRSSSRGHSASAADDESPMKSRSGRRIIVKGGGRYNKALRTGSASASAEDDEDAEGEDDKDEDESDDGKEEEAERKAGQQSSPFAPVNGDRPLGNGVQARTSPMRTRGSKPPQAEPVKGNMGIFGELDIKIETDSEEEEQGDGKGARAHAADADLLLETADKEKLNVVIKAFAPDLLKMRIAPPAQVAVPQSDAQPGSSYASNGYAKRGAGAERRAARSDTLDDLLVAPDLSLQRLRDHFIKLQNPLLAPATMRAHMTGSHVTPSREDVDASRSRLATISTCIALVNEIARRYRINAEPRKDTEEIKPKRTDGSEYALQMRLPGGDYFTNSVWLSKKEASNLDTGYAHLVSVASAPRAKHSGPVPTLGDRLYSDAGHHADAHAGVIVAPPGVPDSARRQRQEDDDYAKPVSHLYYGPWASFAPTYDSFDGQLSYKTSCALWRAKRDARRVVDQWADEGPSAERDELQDALETLCNNGVDKDAMLRAYDELPATAPGVLSTVATQSVDAILQRNVQLIRRLQALQERRWRELVAVGVKGESEGEGDAELSEPSVEEQGVAQQLVDSLASLLAARPRHEGSSSTVPMAVQLQALSSSAAVDPALLDGRAEAGTWGTLGGDVAFMSDSPYASPTAHHRPLSPPRRPAVIRDSETVKMSGASEERAAMHLARIGHMQPGLPAAAMSPPASRAPPPQQQQHTRPGGAQSFLSGPPGARPRPQPPGQV